MKKRTMAILLAVIMLFAMTLTGCGGDGGGGAADAPGASVTEDGRDANGNIVDRTAYAIYLGKDIFSEEDLAIWEKIEEPSKNPDKVVFRVASTSRSFDETPMARGDKRFFIELKKALGDKIEFQFFMNAALGGTADQILGGLQAGNFEFAVYNVGAFYEYTKAFTPLDVGFLIPDLEAGIAVCEVGSPARELMIERCKEDAGLRVVVMGAIGMRHITTGKHPINTLDDLNGLKIRVQNNNLHMAMFDGLGASPTPIAFAELFTALQQKTVDGQENPIANIFEQNYVEVQDHMTLSNHLYTAAASVMSEKFYQSLSKEFQDAIDKAAAIAQAQSGPDLINCEAAMMEYMESQGMSIVELSDAEIAKFKEVSETVYPLAAEVMGEQYFNDVKAAIEEVVGKL